MRRVGSSPSLLMAGSRSVQVRLEAIVEMITPLFGVGEADRWRDLPRASAANDDRGAA